MNKFQLYVIIADNYTINVFKITLCLLLFTAFIKTADGQLYGKHEIVETLSLDSIFFLGPNDKIPEGSMPVCEIKYVYCPTAFIDCGAGTTVEGLYCSRAEDCEGNIIQFTKEIKKPNYFNLCYRIKVLSFQNNNLLTLQDLRERREAQDESSVPDTADYAVLHFYRIHAFEGSAMKPLIRDENGTEIHRLKNNRKFSIKIRNFGKRTFQIGVKSKNTIELEVNKGEEYFLRYNARKGSLVDRPNLQLVDNWIGRFEFENLALEYDDKAPKTLE